MIRNYKIYTLVVSLIPILIISSACSSSKIEKRIQETEKENELKSNEVLTDDTNSPGDVKLSEESLKALEKLEKNTPEEAASEHDKEIRKEINKNSFEEKSIYKNEEELSQYISYLFFMYHTKEIDAKTFFEKISPHFHDEFRLLLPKEKNDQINTFEILQATFTNHLPADIASYKTTNVVINKRGKEANFYRQYKLENGEEIYYETIIKKEGEKWLLLNDKPAPPYEVITNVDNDFN